MPANTSGGDFEMSDSNGASMPSHAGVVRSDLQSGDAAVMDVDLIADTPEYGEYVVSVEVGSPAKPHHAFPWYKVTDGVPVPS